MAEDVKVRRGRRPPGSARTVEAPGAPRTGPDRIRDRFMGAPVREIPVERG